MPAAPHSVDYQRLFRTLPDTFLLLRPDGTVVDNSDSHVQTSLLPREQAVGQHIFAAYPSAPESQRDLNESHEHVRQHQVPHTMGLLRYDLARPAAQGGGTEERYWQITHYPLFDAEGRLEYILQRPQDVTAQILAARQVQATSQALAESQERSRFILESLPVMVWTNTPAGRPDYFNPRWREYTGRTEQELIASDWQAEAHPGDLAGLLAAWAKALASGQPLQHEYRLRRHDGQYRWILIRAAAQRTTDGHITRWVGSAIDIHEQRQLVAELLQTNEQQAALAEQAYQTYQQSESQRLMYSNLFEQVPAFIAIVRGPAHQYEFVNATHQKMFPHRQLQGLAVAEALPELAGQGLLEVLDRVFATGEPFRDPTMHLRLSPGNNEPLQEVYVDIALQPFREQGVPAGILLFAFEVTDLVLARQALARLRAPSAPAV